MQNFQKIKTYSLAVLLALPLYAFSSNGDGDGNKGETRLKIGFNQRHSQLVSNGDLYADGIKIKRDLSLIDKAQAARALDMDEIPCDGLYGGVWDNTYVNPYKGAEVVPDSFKVDLSNFSMPTMGHITSNFGYRKRVHRPHYGIDLKVQVGDTIYAAFDGKVRLCDYERKGYGYHVVLRHSNGLETVYGHLSKFLVTDDEVVKSGEPIALGGNTGRSSGSHLHFEFRFLGKPIDPTAIVDFTNKVCHRDYYEITPQTFNYGFSTASRKYVAHRSKTSGKNKYVAGNVKFYRVKSGDTLYAIARRNKTTVSKLCALNSMHSSSKLKPGKSIRVS